MRAGVVPFKPFVVVYFSHVKLLESEEKNKNKGEGDDRTNEQQPMGSKIEDDSTKNTTMHRMKMNANFVLSLLG